MTFRITILYYYADCCYADYCYAECHYIECRYVEFRYAECKLSVVSCYADLSSCLVPLC